MSIRDMSESSRVHHGGQLIATFDEVYGQNIYFVHTRATRSFPLTTRLLAGHPVIGHFAFFSSAGVVKDRVVGVRTYW